MTLALPQPIRILQWELCWAIFPEHQSGCQEKLIKSSGKQVSAPLWVSSLHTFFWDCQPRKHMHTTGRASERKFSKRYEGQYRAPKSYRAPQALSGPMPLNHFLSDGCRFSFKSEGDNDIHIQLGPMKNTTRHNKIGLDPARGFWGTLWAPPAESGAEPRKL